MGESLLISVMDLQQQADLIRSSPYLQPGWYRREYPDVAMTRLHPAMHYLKYGAHMGRNPAPKFDTDFYLSAYPDVAQSGLNPLVHYLLHGRDEGRWRSPDDRARILRAAKRRVFGLRRRLLNQGFDEQPLADLRQELDSPDRFVRAYAARELAVWHFRANTPHDFQAALDLLPRAHDCEEEAEYFSELSVLELLCLHFVGRPQDGDAVVARAQAQGWLNADIWLARSNLAVSLSDKLDYINRALSLHSIAPVRALAEHSVEFYDRLTVDPRLVPPQDGPKITVLVAAYNARDTLATTLRSLQEQTWRNLEILILDDCSTDDTCDGVEEFMRADPRIRLIRMETNGGAYVARNRGLDQATGEFVTIHDADDWSHPVKIETQARYLMEHGDAIGCTSQQARARADLTFSRVVGCGKLNFANISSFMFRRAVMREHFGYWDTVRFSADSELIRRMQAKFGEDAVVHIDSGPLSFQRESATSIVAHEFLGMNGALNGARLDYYDAQARHHERDSNLKYTNDPQRRPFSVPRNMCLPADTLSKPAHLDVIHASDLRRAGLYSDLLATQLGDDAKAGRSAGVFQIYSYDCEPADHRRTLPTLRDAIDASGARMLVHGERATCDLLIIGHAQVLQHRQRFLPQVAPKRIWVVIDEAPDENGEDFDLLRCAAHVKAQFGLDAVWYPASSGVRQALLSGYGDAVQDLDLAAEDWESRHYAARLSEMGITARA